MSQLTPSVAVVTGASRRFGLALCEYLLSNNWQVVGISRKASKELSALKGEITILEASLSEPSECDAVVQQLKERFDGIHLLVHNASVFERDTADTDVWGTLEKYMHVHVLAPAQMNHGLYRQLKSVGGQIIHLTDIFAQRPRPEFSLYCSSKAALENMTLSLAQKWAPEVRVNGIAPGPVKFLPTHTSEAKAAVLGETPLAYEGGFDALLLAVEYLLRNDFVTGEILKVDGGRSIA